MALVPVVQCPNCERPMKPHCPGHRCGWWFCLKCAITYEARSKKHIEKGY
jgi:hypothetical protein